MTERTGAMNDAPQGLHPLDGPATDAFRIRVVVESAYHHVDEQLLRARRNASADADFARINQALQQAQQHLALARNLASEKFRALTGPNPRKN